MEHLEEFLGQYVITALWCGIERPENDPEKDTDKLYDVPQDKLAPETLETMRRDCERFLKDAAPHIEAAIATGEVSYGPDCCDEWERAGHDFWLTRNGHGAGFWDGDWPEPQAKILTDLSKARGERDLYMGDDGRVHCF